MKALAIRDSNWQTCDRVYPFERDLPDTKVLRVNGFDQRSTLETRGVKIHGRKALVVGLQDMLDILASSRVRELGEYAELMNSRSLRTAFQL
jgi:hypothetical protein